MIVDRVPKRTAHPATNPIDTPDWISRDIRDYDRAMRELRMIREPGWLEAAVAKAAELAEIPSGFKKGQAPRFAKGVS